MASGGALEPLDLSLDQVVTLCNVTQGGVRGGGLRLASVHVTHVNQIVIKDPFLIDYGNDFRWTTRSDFRISLLTLL